MPVIKIDKFEGIAPSVDSRNLPPAFAQTAHNLDLRFGDFRPLRDVGDPVPGASVQSGAKTIFRTPSGVWLSSATNANFVNSQINDTTHERVFVTGRGAYPEVWEGGQYYRLGVPSPETAPFTARVEQDDFTSEEWDTAANAIVDAVTQMVKDNMITQLLSSVPNNGGTLGGLWLTNSSDDELASLPSTFAAYAVPATGTQSAPTITAMSDRYLVNPSLGGRMITYLGSTRWIVSALWRPTGKSVNAQGLAGDMLSLKRPPENIEDLFTSDQANAIATRIADLFDSTKNPVLTKLNSVIQRQQEVVNQLLRTDANDALRAAALSAAAAAMDAEIRSLDSYYARLEADLRANTATVLNAYRSLLPSPVARSYETRTYVYTYVNDWGWESAPSPPSVLLEVDNNDTVDVTVVPPSWTAPYVPVSKWRLYRSSTTNDGGAYQLVSEFNTSQLTVSDAKLQEALEDTVDTLTWVPPPAELVNLIGMPNGIMAGFFGKTVCFSEPFVPYAWPVEYQQTVEHKIVGLGVFGQTLVVLTEGNPYFISGADSASMSSQKLESTQACVSNRSIVSVEGGVIFASPDGICIATPQGVEIATTGAYDKFDWQALGLKNSFATFSEGVYYIFTEN